MMSWFSDQDFLLFLSLVVFFTHILIFKSWDKSKGGFGLAEKKEDAPWKGILNDKSIVFIIILSSINYLNKLKITSFSGNLFLI